MIPALESPTPRSHVDYASHAHDRQTYTNNLDASGANRNPTVEGQRRCGVIVFGHTRVRGSLCENRLPFVLTPAVQSIALIEYTPTPHICQTIFDVDGALLFHRRVRARAHTQICSFSTSIASEIPCLVIIRLVLSPSRQFSTIAIVYVACNSISVSRMSLYIDIDPPIVIPVPPFINDTAVVNDLAMPRQSEI